MKIYFEDGTLRNPNNLPIKPDYIIDATLGVTTCLNILENINETDNNCIVYTNSIIALNNEYAWDDNNKIPDIFIRKVEQTEFKHIDTLTEKCIRKEHNIAKLYIAKHFK